MIFVNVLKKRTEQILGNEYLWILEMTAVLFLSVYFKLSFKSSVVYNDILNNNWKMTMGYSDGKIIATKPEKTLQEKGVTK